MGCRRRRVEVDARRLAHAHAPDLPFGNERAQVDLAQVHERDDRACPPSRLRPAPPCAWRRCPANGAMTGGPPVGARLLRAGRARARRRPARRRCPPAAWRICPCTAATCEERIAGLARFARAAMSAPRAASTWRRAADDDRGLRLLGALRALAPPAPRSSSRWNRRANASRSHFACVYEASACASCASAAASRPSASLTLPCASPRDWSTPSSLCRSCSLSTVIWCWARRDPRLGLADGGLGLLLARADLLVVEHRDDLAGLDLIALPHGDLADPSRGLGRDRGVVTLDPPAHRDHARRYRRTVRGRDARRRIPRAPRTQQDDDGRAGAGVALMRRCPRVPPAARRRARA